MDEEREPDEWDREALWAEMFATQMVVLAMIKTHPDKDLLRIAFDAIVTSQQLFGASQGGPPLTQTRVYEAIERFRQSMADA